MSHCPIKHVYVCNYGVQVTDTREKYEHYLVMFCIFNHLFSLQKEMNRSTQDSTHYISSDSEPEQNLDEVYDRVVHNQGEKQTKTGDTESRKLLLGSANQIRGSDGSEDIFSQHIQNIQ